MWWVLFAAFWCVACSGESPPFDELSLRDSLEADPASIAALPAESRARLAERFEAARRRATSGDEPAMPSNVDPARLVQRIDDARHGRGEDALMPSTLRQAEAVTHVESIDDATDASSAPSLPPIETDTPATSATRDEETLALNGAAGQIVAAALRRAGAHRVIRVTGWPAAVIALGDVVYVNASWLVAMASHDRARDVIVPMTYTPLTLPDNPYRLYPSSGACAADTRSRCDQCLRANECDPQATLRDFSDARAECTWINASTTEDRAALLCTAAMLSIDSIADCVRMRQPTCMPGDPTNTVSSVEFTMSFASRTECVQALDLCVANGGDAGVISDAGSSSYAFRSGCSTPSCSGPSCSGPTCSSPTCSSPSCSYGSCGSGCSSSSCSTGTCHCTVAPRREEPWRAWRMLASTLVPLLYLLLRGRRA
jgi:hypothetical protein